MFFNNNLILLKTVNGLSSYKISDMTGVPVSTIKEILMKKNENPKIEIVIKVARAFNLSLDEIVLTDLSKKET